MKRRLKKLVAGLALAGLCTAAHADPVSIAALLANAALAATATTLTVGQLIAATIAVTALNAAASSRAQRAAAAKARAAYNASLQDKQLVLRSAIMPRPVIYGRAMVGGAIVFAHTSGTRSEFLHLVVAIAGHQCDAIEEIWFNDQQLPTPDANGDIQSGAFARIENPAEVTVSGLTTIELGQNPTSIASVTRTRGDEVSALTLGTDYSRTGSTLTILTGHVAGDTYTVNWTWTRISPRVRLRTYLGAPGQTADPQLIAAAPGRWTSAHVGQGITYAYIRLEYDQEVFGQVGVPEMRFVVRGKRVRDPRDGVTRWTQNAALGTADYLQDAVHGLGATAAEVPDAEVIAAANTCDEEVVLYNTGTVSVTNGATGVTGTGTAWSRRVRRGMLFRGPDGVSREVLSVASDTLLTLASPYTGPTASGAHSIRQRRYTVNGALGTDASPRDNLQALVDAMAGGAVWVQGRWLVRAGAARALEPVLDVDSLADGDITILPRAPRANLFNTVTGTFLDRSARYAESQWPEVTSSLYRTQDGGVRIARDLPMPLVDDATAAQRLGKIELERHRQALTVTLRTNLRAYDLVPTDWVPLAFARYGWANKIFEVLARRATPGGTIEYTLRETAAAVYDWAMGEQTLIDLAPNTLLPDPFTPPAALTGVTVASGTTHLLRLADGSIITRGFVTWTASTDIFVRSGGRIEIEFKRDDETTWTAAAPEAGDATSAYIGPLEDRRLTLVRVRPVNSLQRAGAWTTVLHTVIGKTAPPSDVTGLAAAVVPGALRATWAPCPDADYAVTELRRGTTWATGTRLDTGAIGSSEVAGTVLDVAWPAPGSYTIMARHRDTTGNLSATVQTTTIVVTATALGIPWADVAGRPGTFRVTARGFSSTSHPIEAGVRNGETGAQLLPPGRSFNFMRISRSTGQPVLTTTRDVFAGTAQADLLAGDLNATDSGHIAVVYTFDDPSPNRLHPALLTAMLRCGASRAVYATTAFRTRSAYILIGIGGCGEGNGFETRAGDVDNDVNAWADVAFQVLSGNLIVTGTNATPRTIVDYGYVGDLNATNGAPAGTLVGGTEASALAASAAAATSAIAAIVSDNVLSRPEKPEVIVRVQALQDGHAGLVALAQNRMIGAELSAYTTAYNALNTYLATLTSPTAWNNTGGDTTIVGATFRANFAAVYNALAALQYRIEQSQQASGNRLANSSFEIDSDGNGNSDGWEEYAAGTIGGTVIRSRSTENGIRGGFAQRINAPGLGTTTSDRVGTFQDVPLLNIGARPFIFSVHCLPLAGLGWRGRVFVQILNGGTVVQQFDSGQQTAGGGSWLRWEVRGTLPATATTARCFVWAEQNNSVGPAAFDLDDAQFVFGEVLPAYAPRGDELLPGTATVVLSSQIAAASGTANANQDNTLGVAVWPNNTKSTITAYITGMLTQMACPDSTANYASGASLTFRIDWAVTGTPPTSGQREVHSMPEASSGMAPQTGTGIVAVPVPPGGVLTATAIRQINAAGWPTTWQHGPGLMTLEVILA